jgi:hypothetical protein
MSGYVKKLPTGATVEQKLDYLQREIELLNDDIKKKSAEIAALKKVVDLEIPTRRLFELIKNANVHTSSMPDMSGYNGDHDRRYITRDEDPLHGFTYFGTRGRRLWRIGVDSGDLVIQFDPNFGVGTPDFANGEVLRYHPNFN